MTRSLPSPAPRDLRRVLGRRDVLALAFGAMIGWGWVVLAGVMIERAGTLGSALAFVAGAVMVYLVGLTYAELTSALSRAGGEISFTYLAFGPRAAYVCGWALVLAYLSICAFEAVALPTVAGYLFPELRFGYLYTIAGWDVHLSWILVSIAGTLAVALMNHRGIRMASFIQSAAALLLLLVGVSFFVPGNLRGDLANLAPSFTTAEGFFRVVIMTPFLFLGFDVIPQLAEEIDVPFRTVGKLLLVSILMALVWYVLVQWTVGLTLDLEALARRELATADAMSAVYGSRWAGRVLVLGGLLGILTSWNAFFIGATRLVFAMSRGAMLSPAFSRLHPRYESPTAAILLITAISLLAPFFGRQALVWLVDAGGLATVVAYFFVAVSFLKVRARHPHLPRPYRTRAGALVGGLAVAATLFFILLYLPPSPSALLWPAEWMIVLFWSVLGIAFYRLARERRAAVGGDEQDRLVLGEHTVEVIRGGAPRV